MLNARKSTRMENELQLMELNIAICDDEKIIREQIKELAEKEIPGVCAGLYETGMLCLPPGNGVYKDEEEEFFTGKDSILYIIEIENSLDGSSLSRGDSGLPISTKKDKEVHGIGLKNIRKCAVKYGGDSG